MRKASTATTTTWLERHAVEAGIRETVIVADEEAIEHVHPVEREAADDSRPGELDHLEPGSPVDSPCQVEHVLAQREDKRDADSHQ